MSNMTGTHSALELTAEQAVVWAEKHPSWYIFPARVVARDDEPGSWSKHPLVKWRDAAVSFSTSGGDAVKQLWLSKVGSGSAALAVACSPSGIWVLDEDHEVPADSPWFDALSSVLASRLTLVLKSCTKSKHHYVFAQPADSSQLITEGKWDFGEVKASGYVIISNLDPFVNVTPRPAPKSLVDMLKLSTKKGKGGFSMTTTEGMWEWLSSSNEHETILSYSAGRKFLDSVIAKLDDKVDRGEHRRMATLEAVFSACLEAASGFYSPLDAYQALRDAYMRLRDNDGSWNSQRAQDYDNMWGSLIPAFQAGIFDNEINENRTRVGDDISAEEVSAFEDIIASWSNDPLSVSDDNSIEVIIQNTEKPTKVPFEVRAWPEPDPEDPPSRVAKTLQLGDDAYWGPYGDFLAAKRGNTEASEAGMLAALLGLTGAVLGGRVNVQCGDYSHGPNLFTLIIGRSSIARKSMALGIIKNLLFGESGNIYEMLTRELGSGPNAALLASELANEWPRKTGGIASGEMVIRTWQPLTHKDASGDGFSYQNPRIVITENEMGSLWKKAHRDGSTLSDVINDLWDGNELAAHAVTSGSSVVPKGRHICSIIGASTVSETRRLCTSGDATSGFGNRFLWFWLPDGDLDIAFPKQTPKQVVAKFRTSLLDAVDRWPSTGGGIWSPDIRYEYGKYDIKIGVPVAPFPLIPWDTEAIELFETIYTRLKREKGPDDSVVQGLRGRAETQVLRIALNYQMITGGKTLTAQAIKSGLAVWQYCEESVVEIFGDMSGSVDSDNLAAHLRSVGGYATLYDLKKDWHRGPGLAKLLDDAILNRTIREGTIKLSRRGPAPKAYALLSSHMRGQELAPECSGGTRLDQISWLTSD